MPNDYALEKSWSSSGKCLGNKISQKELSAAGEGEYSTFLMKMWVSEASQQGTLNWVKWV